MSVTNSGSPSTLEDPRMIREQQVVLPCDNLQDPIVLLSEQQQLMAAQQKQLLERLERAEFMPRGKDRWDRLAAIAPIVSATIIALGGAWFTAIYNQQQLKLQEIQTIEKFFPHLTGDEKSKRAAILAISSLGDAKLASKVAGIFASEGTVSALEQIARHGETSDRKIANGALARALDSMAANYQTDKRYEDAIKTYERALALREESYGTESPRILPSLNQLVDLYKAHHDCSEAEGLLQRAIAIQKNTYGSDSPQVAIELRRLADVYQAEGVVEKSRAIAAKATAIEEKNGGASHGQNSDRPGDELQAEVESSDPALLTSSPSRQEEVSVDSTTLRSSAEKRITPACASLETRDADKDIPPVEAPSAEATHPAGEGNPEPLHARSSKATRIN